MASSCCFKFFTMHMPHCGRSSVSGTHQGALLCCRHWTFEKSDDTHTQQDLGPLTAVLRVAMPRLVQSVVDLLVEAAVNQEAPAHGGDGGTGGSACASG
eukprot:3715578-Amphidinium_carterae.1